MKKYLFIILLFICSFAYAPMRTNQQSGADSSTVLLLHCNKGSGTTAYDVSGENNHGELIGNTVWVDGLWEKGLDLDGDGDNVNCGTGASLFPTDEFTYAVWVKFGDVDDNSIVVCSDTNLQSAIWIDDAAGRIQFRMSDGLWKSAKVTTGLSINVWYYIVGTYKENDYIRLYINGDLKAATAVGTVVYHANKGMSFGARHTLDPTYFLNGLIDEAVIYNRTLSAAEIKYNYQSQSLARQ